ncbi:helix-turn-helix domain-containing protein [Actinokineospora enzanensis]|uniref:helix-turn-helix domain-containing protein n=1 Tax=Actinokineospora enzanensis TaxID=155975 RepID=UPI0003AA9821|nr:helix-turn-helix transcriptional regulator [Actinokineospora enzanensis]
MERVDPQALRWLIGVELANQRKRVGISQAEAGRAVRLSAAMVAHFEVGRYFPSPEQIASLLRCYGASEEETERLAALARRADRSGWLARWVDVIPDWQRTYLGLEGLASHVVAYAPLVVHGLAQTEAYAAGVIANSARVRPDQAGRLVRLRMERQRRLLGPEPLRLTMLVEESVLDRPIGGEDAEEVMRGQLALLLDLGARDGVEILVLPTALGRHDSLEGQFTMLRFADPGGGVLARPVVYIEIADDGVYIHNERQVAQYARDTEQLRAVAMSAAESADAIRARLATLAGSAERPG